MSLRSKLVSLGLSACFGGWGCLSAAGIDTCEQDGDCTNSGAAGVCQADGWCSYADPACPSGLRYEPQAGGVLGDTCVPQTSTDDGEASVGATSEMGTDSGTFNTSTGESSSLDGSSTTTGVGCEAWWDPSFGHRLEISLASVPTDPLADVPLLVRLDPARFSYEHAKSDGSDLRFVGEDGTELAHEIEGWDADGDSWIWVRIPSVNAVGQRFYLYFDNASADAPEAAASVWSNEYLTVLHLSDELADSVGTVDLVDSNTFVGFGQVGLSRVFTINEAQIALSDDDALDDLYSTGVTISGWIRVDRLDSWQVFMGKCDDPYDPFEGSILVADGSWAAIWGHDIDATGHWWGTSPLVEAQWHWFAISFDPADWGGSFIMVDDTITRFDYWDDVGADVLTSDAAFPFVLAPQNTVDTSAFLGALDEVRIAAAPRSLAWLTFQRLSMRDELLEFGPVQTVPPCVP